jgi:autotransporter-associated beta strand protein
MLSTQAFVVLEGFPRVGKHVDISAATGNREVGGISGGADDSILLGTNTLTIGRNNTNSTFVGRIGGQGGLVKEGTGTLTLSGMNSFAGPLTIAEGIVRANTASLSSNVTNNGTLVLLPDEGILEFSNATPAPKLSVYSHNISGSGNVVKEGAVAIWLRGVDTYTGGTRIDAGILIGNTDSLQGNITNNSGLAFYQVADGAYAGRLEGTGTLYIYGPGVLTLAGNNTYTGGTVFSGNVRVANESNLGAAASGVVMVGGTLQAAADLTSSRQFSVSGSGGTFDTMASTYR